MDITVELPVRPFAMSLSKSLTNIIFALCVFAACSQAPDTEALPAQEEQRPTAGAPAQGVADAAAGAAAGRSGQTEAGKSGGSVASAAAGSGGATSGAGTLAAATAGSAAGAAGAAGSADGGGAGMSGAAGTSGTPGAKSPIAQDPLSLEDPGERSNAGAPDCSDIAYRDNFSGTSSAGPVVASAAAVISSIAQERGYLLTSKEVRELLKKTGTPQGGSKERNIGALPNLRAAIEQMQP